MQKSKNARVRKCSVAQMHKWCCAEGAARTEEEQLMPRRAVHSAVVVTAAAEARACSRV